MRLDELLPCLVVQQPGNFTLVLDRVERRAGNVDVALLDQSTKLLVEKGKQQALDVQPIHIGIGGDDHAIELEATDIKEIARPGAKHIYDCPDLFVLDEAVQVSLGYVERLTFELEHGLKLREAPRTSTAASRVALYDKEFRASGVIGV